MRVAFFNLGGRVAEVGKTPSSGQAYIQAMLIANAGIEVHIFTKLLSDIHPHDNLYFYDVDKVSTQLEL